MNTKRYKRLTPMAAALLFLLLILLPGSMQAQGHTDKNDDEGIVMYSDTSGTASTDSYPTDADDDEEDQTEYADSTWSSAPQTGSLSFLLNDSSLSHPFRLMGDLFHSMLGVGLFLAIVLVILAVLVPLLLIAGLVYLILRLTRPASYRPAPGEPPLTPDEIRERQKQQTVRLACIGVALILVEWFFGMANIAGIVGFVLLCIAAGQWLTSKR